MPITISGDGTITGALDVTGAGTVAYFAMSTAPSGWLKANGAAVSRTTYSNLFGKIGTTFGAGDGSTTFNVPDLRGEFPRGWDDGRGVDSGRGFGTAQLDELRSHAHLSNLDAADAGTAITFVGAGTYARVIPYARTATNVGVSGGTETRSRNIALLACIKF